MESLVVVFRRTLLCLVERISFQSSVEVTSCVSLHFFVVVVVVCACVCRLLRLDFLFTLCRLSLLCFKMG